MGIEMDHQQPDGAGNRASEPSYEEVWAKVKEFWATGAVILLVLGISVWLYWTCVNSKESESAGELIGLFCIPFVLTVSLVFLLRKHGFLNPLVISVVVFHCLHAVFGLLYFNRDPGWPGSGLLALLAFLSAIASMVVVISMTWFLLNRENGRYWMESARSLKRHRFSTVLLFLNLFTLATFFLGYSLAFDDLYRQGRQGEWGPEGKYLGLYGVQFPVFSQANMDTPKTGQQPLMRWTFSFKRSRAELSVLREEEDSDPRNIRNLQPELRPAANNARHLKELVTHLVSLNEFRVVHVLVAGHADEEGFSPGQSSFSSNHELSSARAEQVVSLLLRRLQEVDAGSIARIEWLPFAFSNTRSALAEDQTSPPTPSVEVLVIPSASAVKAELPEEMREGRNLTLLDYMYFSAYTITTTGYGDIIPVSAFSKMVCTYANLFEVIFMVIFFNVLLSFLGHGGGEGGRDKGQGAAA